MTCFTIPIAFPATEWMTVLKFSKEHPLLFTRSKTTGRASLSEGVWGQFDRDAVFSFSKGSTQMARGISQRRRSKTWKIKIQGFIKRDTTKFEYQSHDDKHCNDQARKIKHIYDVNTLRSNTYSSYSWKFIRQGRIIYELSHVSYWQIQLTYPNK